MSLKPSTKQIIFVNQKNDIIIEGNNNEKPHNKARNIKIMKISDALKNIYSNETGELINALKLAKSLRTSLNSKFNKQKAEKFDNGKVVNTDNITSSKYSHSNFFITHQGSKMKYSNIEENNEKLNDIDIKNITPTLNKFRSKLTKFKNYKTELSSASRFRSKSNNFSITDKKDHQYSSEEYPFKTDPSKKKNESRYSNSHYCPFCNHCNQMQDKQLEQYFFILKEVKSIISRSFEYLINSRIIDNNHMNLFGNESSRNMNTNHQLNNNNSIGLNQDTRNDYNNTETRNIKTKSINTIRPVKNISLQALPNPHLNPNSHRNLNLNSTMSDPNSTMLADSLLRNFPKPVISNRLTYITLFRSLDALLEDKIGIEHLVNQELSDYFKNESLIATGLSFNILENNSEKVDTTNVQFDKELDKYFDDKFKNTIKSVLKKKNLLTEIFPIKDVDIIQTKKKFMFLFLIFLQILSEISKECKEEALLLYKFFKCYFAEHEKKWVIIINRFKDKVSYYKNLCKLIIQQKNKHLEKIEKISDVLSQNRISKENLNEHKSLIYDLLNIINEKRDDIYLLKSKIEILENELKFWIHDYETLKMDNLIREKMKNFDFKSVGRNLKQEMFHKKISQAEYSLLMNADVYLLISGQRNYFFDQKNYYLSEISRLSELYKTTEEKKRVWKKKHSDVLEDLTQQIKFLEHDLQYYKEKVIIINIYAFIQDKSLKVESFCQTDIDYLKMNKLFLNTESFILYKSMNNNRLVAFIERIKFGCCTEKPFSKKSLLNLIVDLYTEKAYDDLKYELEPFKKKKFDLFFYEYMQIQFKLKKSVKQHTEMTILTILKYSSEDSRIETFRKFLGVGDEQHRREILDIYLILIKCKLNFNH